MEEKFIEFLKEKGLKLAYEAELKKYRGITMKAYLKRYSWNRFGAHKVLQNGFRFIDTPQGREFWIGINTEWRELVASIPKEER